MDWPLNHYCLMKNLMSNLIKTTCILAIICLHTFSTNVYGAVDQPSKQCAYANLNANVYTWSYRGPAESFMVMLSPRGSGTSITFNTTGNGISLAGIDKGVYRVSVYAIFHNKKTALVVQETISIGKANTTSNPTTIPKTGSEDI